MRRFALLMTSTALLVTFVTNCGKREEKVLATVEGRQITLGQFEELFQRRPQEFESAEDELEERRKLLNELIDQQLLVIGAQEEKLDQDESVKEQLTREEQKILLDMLYQREVVKKSKVNENDLRDFYERQGEEIKARHILAKTEEEANQIKEEIEGGADFDALAREKSADETTKDKGGDLGFFKWGKMVASFQEAAFKLKPGEVSEPVKSRFGWHIIKVEERRQVPQQDFESMKQQLERELVRARQQEMADEFIEQLKSKAKIEFNQEALSLLKEGSTQLTPEQKEMALVTYRGGAWTLGRLIKESEKAPSFRRPKLDDELRVTRFVEGALVTDLLEEEARRRGLNRSDEFRRRMIEQEENILSSKMKEDVVLKGVTISEEEIEEFYNENQESYMTKEMVNVREIQVKTQEEAEEVLKSIKRGADFAKLAEEKSLRTWAAKKGGELGLFPKTRYPNISAVAFDMKIGEVKGPIQEGDNFSIIKLIDKKQAQLQPLDEIKGRVKSAALQQKKDNALEKWLNYMREKAKVEIDEALLETTVAFGTTETEKK